MMPIPQALAQAWQLLQAGQWQRAEQGFRQVLEIDPNQAEAWHLLGIIAGQTGRHGLAVEYFQAAIRINPEVAETHDNLGLALQAQGRWAEAALRHQQAIRLRPDFAGAHANLARALQMQGNLADAVLRYQNALRLQPDQALTHYNLGLALQEQNKTAEAEVSLENAVRLRPDFAEAYHSLGSILQLQGRLPEAVASYHQALRYRADDREVLQKLGVCLRELDQPDEAVQHLERAVGLDPNSALLRIDLAAALVDQLRPNEAAGHLEQAIHLEPLLAEAHYSLGFLRLLQGNLEQGWPEHEWRLQLKDQYRVPSSLPLWDGGELGGKTLLIHAEQGLGDTLQFIRYATVVKERGATTVVSCPAALLGLLAGCAGIDQLHPPDKPLPPCDVHACLLSLPGLCGTTLSTIPAKVPYLFVDPSRRRHWQERLARDAGFKVGICWQGNPAHRNNRRRSVSLAQFASLAEVPGVRLVRLQKGSASEEWDRVAGQWPTLELSDQPQNPADAWVESAALVGALDLVITVDTAVAHLAGALGVPVWVVLPFSPDWRWLLDRDDSPWYASMRLFRQTRPGDWTGVFQRIKGCLESQLDRRLPV